MQRILWQSNDWRVLERHFQAAGRKEDGAFLLVHAGRSESGARLLVQKVLLPPRGGLERQGPDTLRPSGQWLSAVIGAAIESQCGLAFIHSHPDPLHPPVLSSIDWETSIEWSKSFAGMLDGPFSSLVWSPRGVTGITFAPSNPKEPIVIDRAESLGDSRIEQLHPVTEVLPSPDADLDDRQIRALSALGNSRLRSLDIGVVGAGGTGSPLAEQLVRLGVGSLVIIDPDELEMSNVRRVVGSTVPSVGEKKARVVVDHLRSLKLSSKVVAISEDVRHESAIRRLLDCDIVFVTTDTQSSRAMLNQVAYQYWVPVIDVGVRIGTDAKGAISGMPVEVRILLPDNGCLWCRGALDSQRIYEENLPDAEHEKLEAEGYVQGLGNRQPSIAPLNYLAASLAALTMLRLYSTDAQAVPGSTIFDGWEQYVHPLKDQIRQDCICKRWRGFADSMSVSFLPSA